MDFLVMRMRKHAFRAMVKAYSPTIPLAYIQVLTDSSVVFCVSYVIAIFEMAT